MNCRCVFKCERVKLNINHIFCSITDYADHLTTTVKPGYLPTPKQDIIPHPDFGDGFVTKSPFNPVLKTDGPYWKNTNPLDNNKNSPFPPGKVLPASDFQNDDLDLSRGKDNQHIECSGTFLTVCTCVIMHHNFVMFLFFLISINACHFS